MILVKIVKLEIHIAESIYKGKVGNITLLRRCIMYKQAF